jgi:hypothetical protein
MNPSTTEVKAGGLRVPGQPDYTEKPCLKNKKQKQKTTTKMSTNYEWHIAETSKASKHKKDT